MNWEIIGYIGGACTTFCFVPQILKALKTKELDDFSYAYLFVLGFGVLCWLLYGLAIWDTVIVSANSITLLFVLLVTFMKWKFERK